MLSVGLPWSKRPKVKFVMSFTHPETKQIIRKYIDSAPNEFKTDVSKMLRNGFFVSIKLQNQTRYNLLKNFPSNMPAHMRPDSRVDKYLRGLLRPEMTKPEASAFYGNVHLYYAPDLADGRRPVAPPSLSGLFRENAGKFKMTVKHPQTGKEFVKYTEWHPRGFDQHISDKLNNELLETGKEYIKFHIQHSDFAEYLFFLLVPEITPSKAKAFTATVKLGRALKPGFNDYETKANSHL